MSSVSLSVSIFPSVCESGSLSVGLFGRLPVSESVKLPIYFGVCLTVCLPVLFVRLAVGLSVGQSVSLSVRKSVCLSVCRSGPSAQLCARLTYGTAAPFASLCARFVLT